MEHRPTVFHNRDRESIVNPFVRFSTTFLITMAAPVIAHAGDWSGPYAGLGMGYQTSSVDTSGSVGDDSLGLDLGASGALLSGYSGYGWNRGSLYLGGEASYGFSSMGGRLRLNDSSVDYDARDTWGLSGVMGGLINRDTLVYGRAGYQQRKNDLSLPGFRDQDWQDGLRLGAGAELRLWDHTSLRFEYSRIWFDEGSIASGDDTIDYQATDSWFEAGGTLRF